MMAPGRIERDNYVLNALGKGVSVMGLANNNIYIIALASEML